MIRQWTLVVDVDGDLTEELASTYIEAARVAIARTMLSDPRVRSVDVSSPELTGAIGVDELPSDPGLGAQPALDGSLEPTTP